ncbi:MAG: hypothetical protein GY874_12500 [Desulfobacteraceae bacterium]|nr:hypothetical protein [Desulfobacteraceae bacterium]
MRIKYFCLSFFLFFPVMILNGCGIKKQGTCKPVLFPANEYTYKAKSQKVSGSYTLKAEETVDFHGVNIPIPKGWRYKKDFNESVLKIFKNKPFFLLIFNEGITAPSNEYKDFRMIGCKNFNPKIDKEKSSKEFYTDLFLFTEADLSKNPSFWQYYVLWFKTKIFREATELDHYIGKTFEAFQYIIDPEIKASKQKRTITITIFPQKITPHFLTLTSEIKDDALFDEFLKMLDAANSQ